jgi:hypothetical protein
MSSKIIRCIWLAAVLLRVTPLCAQSLITQKICKKGTCCTNNDPTPAGIMISHVHEKAQWMLSYRYMQMNMGGVLSGTQTSTKSDVFNNYIMYPNAMRMDMHMLMGMYGITNRLTVMAMAQYISNNMTMDMFTKNGHVHGSTATENATITHAMSTAGIGDMQIHLLYGLILQPNHQFLLSAGASIPSGNIQIKGKMDDAMYPHRSYPYAMQLGSGTYDVLPCVNYLYEKEKLTFSTQLSGVIRTAFNENGYHFGNEATLNSWLAYAWLPSFSNSVRVAGNVTDKIYGRNTDVYIYNEPSANPANYGGKNVQAYIGSVFRWKNTLRLSVEYGLPLYQNLHGTQMKLQQTLNASISTAF